MLPGLVFQNGENQPLAIVIYQLAFPPCHQNLKVHHYWQQDACFHSQKFSDNPGITNGVIRTSEKNGQY